MAIENLITDHLDLWTAAVRPKSSAGRGSNSKLELTGIKKLRELILELAVRGKLVPQDPSDEPASVLLERIAAEKTRLVKEGKIKKPKALPEIGEEDKPFELPEGWECIRLGDLTSKMGSGSTPRGGQSAYVSEGIPFLRSQNVWNEGLRLDDVVYIDENTHLKMEGTKVIPGDVLLNITGASLGRTLIFPDSIKEANVSQHVTIIRLLIDELAPFVHLGIKSPLVQDLIWGRQVGMAIEGLSKRTLELFEFPIPPLAEQQRIVAKVDELMVLCDQLEQRCESQLAAHQTLVETLLATLTDSCDADELAQSWARLSTHFDTLFTTEASIDALKQTILQLAVMGKLVPQDPSDEPAIDLLNRLVSKRDEWLKKESKENSEAMTMLRKLKKLTVPTAPFELPKAWACAHLIQLSQMLVDCHNKTAPYVEVGIPIIRTTNIRERQFIDRDLKFVSKETYDYWSRRCPPEPGDIIFTREAPMGEALIIPAGETWCLGQRTMLIRPMHEFVSNKFLLLALTEPHLLERASEHAVGLTVKHLRVGDVENLSIPLPPLAEQHRIVAKVDELMALCDQLTSRLQTSQQTQLALAESLVEGALA
ncbi:restriction endonuclease subunit S [Aeromonas veronii]|uniref:restriction endonuclease subunit S n=1 Tax=Aeromonas veronii TaxID=654 RepID=UPI002A6A23D0|nr:restriction endonuclease subunit S [Aeromonas veronii]